MVISLVLNFALNGPVLVGMPWLADQRFAAGPAGLGLLAASWAAGALIGVVVAGSIRLERQGRILLGAVICAASEILVGVLPSLSASGSSLRLMGVAIGYANIVAISWIQARVDHAMIGRVMSLVMLMGVGITPLSLAVSGRPDRPRRDGAVRRGRPAHPRDGDRRRGVGVGRHVRRAGTGRDGGACRLAVRLVAEVDTLVVRDPAVGLGRAARAGPGHLRDVAAAAAGNRLVSASRRPRWWSRAPLPRPAWRRRCAGPPDRRWAGSAGRAARRG